MDWLVLGWLALSLGAAAVYHRRRRRARPRVPGEVRRFLHDLERGIAAHPDVEMRGILPGRFAAVIAIRGQECPVSLHPLFRRWGAFPDAFDEVVRGFLDEVAADALDGPGDHEFADVAGSILPQMRSRAWLEEHAGVFGDSALVYRSFTDDIVICYVIDESWCMTFVCRAHLRRWNRTEEDLFHLATANLHRLAGSELPVPDTGDDPILVRTGDGFDAARLLLLDPDRADGLLVAVPERDVLWLGRDNGDADLTGLMARAEQQSQRAQPPVSPRLYRVQSGELVPVTGGGR